MAGSDHLEGITCATPTTEGAKEEESLVEGIAESLKNFADGRYTVFEDDNELEDHLTSL